MNSLRAFALRRSALALWLVALALLMRALVPTGFMIEQRGGQLTVRICQEGTGGALLAQALPSAGAMHAMHHGMDHGVAHESGHGADHGKASSECPYGALSMAASGAGGPVVALMALAFILALGFAPVRLVRRCLPSHIRPPLRAPPAFA